MRRTQISLALLLAMFALLAHGQGEEKESEVSLAREIDGLARRLLAQAEALERASDPEATLTTRFYEVGDLVTPVAQNALQSAELRASIGEKSVPEELESEPPVAMDLLIELMRLGVDPESWEYLDGAEIRPQGTALAVRQTPSRQLKIAAFLDELRHSLGRRFLVEIAVVRVDAESAALLQERPRDLSPEERDRLLAAGIVGSVRLFCREDLLMAQRNGRTRAYLADYDPEVAVNAKIGSPIRSELFEGCAAEARVCRDPRGAGAVVHLRIEQSGAVAPIRRIETKHGPLDLPDLGAIKLATALWVPCGKTVIAGGSTAGGSPRLILLTVKES